MSVLLETTHGDIVIDLLVDYAPKLCENFLKLCKVKYYNYSPVHSVQKGFSFQTGDPLGPLSPDSDGGTSIWGFLSSDPAQRTFPAFFHPKLKHVERGTVGMATVQHATDPDVRLAASQFIVTLGDDTDFLDGKSAIFGRVVEGFDTLEAINNAIVDSNGYPLVDIRIKHSVVLDDPYPDPAGLREPSASPPPSRAQLATARLGEEDQASIARGDDDDESKAADLEKARREREARAQALTLEMIGDLPFADVKPPENVLFVCKLNPVTQDADLELIFSRFGKILSCEVIRDRKTGDSLQYAFVEFEDKKACETAYFKMQDVLIDDRRIHVDFSQSVSKLSDTWRSETNSKRRRNARTKGGWGGVQELEKWRKYRNEDINDDEDSSYAMVHSAEELKNRHERPIETGGDRERADHLAPEHNDRSDGRDGHGGRMAYQGQQRRGGGFDQDGRNGRDGRDNRDIRDKRNGDGQSRGQGFTHDRKDNGNGATGRRVQGRSRSRDRHDDRDSSRWTDRHGRPERRPSRSRERVREKPDYRARSRSPMRDRPRESYRGDKQSGSNRRDHDRGDRLNYR